MPTVGQLASVEFAGDRAASLADRFYYSAAAAAGVQTAGGGLERRRCLSSFAAVEPATPDLATIEAPGGLGDGRRSARQPAHLGRRARVRLGRRGARRARDRCCASAGYLSHALDRRRGDAAVDAVAAGLHVPAERVRSLPRPHRRDVRVACSSARPTRGPRRRRTTSPRSATTSSSRSPWRSSRASSASPRASWSAPGSPRRTPSCRTCDAGVCRAQDLAAWTEVQSAGGRVGTRRRHSAVRAVAEPRGHRAAQPRERHRGAPGPRRGGRPARPACRRTTAPTTAPRTPRGSTSPGCGRSCASAASRCSCCSCVVGPFALIAGAKASRRRSRRTQGAPAAQIAGGWDEYVDAAVDSGRDASPHAHPQRAGRGVRDPRRGSRSQRMPTARCSRRPPTSAADAAAFWRIVDEERHAMVRERGFWRGVVATVSLRSFVRHLAPSGAGSRFAERGKRRVTQPVRVSP